MGWPPAPLQWLTFSFALLTTHSDQAIPLVHFATGPAPPVPSLLPRISAVQAKKSVMPNEDPRSTWDPAN